MLSRISHNFFYDKTKNLYIFNIVFQRNANSVIGDVIYDLLAERKTKMIHELGHSSDTIQDCQFHGNSEVNQDECHK